MDQDSSKISPEHEGTRLPQTCYSAVCDRDEEQGYFGIDKNQPVDHSSKISPEHEGTRLPQTCYSAVCDRDEEQGYFGPVTALPVTETRNKVTLDLLQRCLAVCKRDEEEGYFGSVPALSVTETRNKVTLDLFQRCLAVCDRDEEQGYFEPVPALPVTEMRNEFTPDISSMASLVPTDSSQLTSDSQHLGDLYMRTGRTIIISKQASMQEKKSFAVQRRERIAIQACTTGCIGARRAALHNSTSWSKAAEHITINIKQPTKWIDDFLLYRSTTLSFHIFISCLFLLLTASSLGLRTAGGGSVVSELAYDCGGGVNETARGCDSEVGGSTCDCAIEVEGPATGGTLEVSGATRIWGLCFLVGPSLSGASPKASS
uniref:Uncharacterized protein n=1 Tax=Timema monikensis TaxID=170555 RepID=A0A7R9HPG5_9NEOP|nr:unnamed protein product [Timema monikensis]